MADDRRRVNIPRLTSRSGTVWFFGSLLVGVAVMAYLAYTQPESRWTLWVLVPLMVVPIAVGMSRRRSLPHLRR